MLCEGNDSYDSRGHAEDEICTVFFRADFPAYSYKSFKVYIKTIDFSKILISPIETNDMQKDEFLAITPPLGEGLLEINLHQQVYKYTECQSDECIHVEDLKIFYKQYTGTR